MIRVSVLWLALPATIFAQSQPADVQPGRAAAPTRAAAPIQEGFPFTDEALHYSINWQSGLSLGDATLTARHGANGWDFEVALTAGVPGFAIADTIRSMTDSGICSQALDRDLTHAGKRTHEKTEFDQRAGKARRTTILPAGGGSGTFEIPSCARDAVAFAYYARVELGQGRVPPAQQLYFGGLYSVRMDYAGAGNVKSGDKTVTADRLNVSVKGPKSDFRFEVSYARDPARTPLQIRIPLSLGTFTLELVR
jgi:hypothetical protein